MITLKNITWENFHDVIQLKPRKDQEAFTKPTSVFMAQGYVNQAAEYLDTLKAITRNDSVIGFAKWVHVPQEVKPYRLKEDATMIDAFMLDQNHQSKGLGKEAFKSVLKAIRSDQRYTGKHIVLLCHKDNVGAHDFFDRFGFCKTPKTTTINGEEYLWFQTTK